MRKNNTILLSVVVPIYNGAKYIGGIINSLGIERYPMCELIIIDDGSTDNVNLIFPKLRKKENISCVSLDKNYGVAYARNYGINIARGKYITFLDSDDVFTNDALEKYIRSIKAFSVDLIISGTVIMSNGYCCKKYTAEDSLMHKEEFLDKMFEYDFFNKVRYGVLWGKIYKRELLVKECIRFECGYLIGEDTWFNIDYYNKAQKIYILSDITYKHILQNRNSLSKQYEKQYLIILIETINRYKKMFIESGKREMNRFIIYKTGQAFFRIPIYYCKHWLKNCVAFLSLLYTKKFFSHNQIKDMLE